LAAVKAAWESFCLGPLAGYAVYAEWGKEKPLPRFYGFAATVDTNSNKKINHPAARIKFWIWLMQLGAKTGCHQLHDRSFFFKGYQFPVCARCTGLFIGQVMGLSLFYFFLKFDLKILFMLAFISLLALGIDGILQVKKIYFSNNLRRLITGILCGHFVMCFNAKIITMVIAKCGAAGFLPPTFSSTGK
jgi:uncharacterized membrane protein